MNVRPLIVNCKRYQQKRNKASLNGNGSMCELYNKKIGRVMSRVMGGTDNEIYLFMASMVGPCLAVLKLELTRKGSGVATELLDIISKDDPERLHRWAKTGGTIELRRMAATYESHSIYDQRNDRLPHFNDVCSIDSALLSLRDKGVSL